MALLKKKKPSHKNSSKEELVRFQVVFNAKTIQRLDALKDRMEAYSRAEVLRKALRLTEIVYDSQENGNEFWVKTEGGEEQKCHFFL